MPYIISTADNTFRASNMTSGPIPSPGNNTIFACNELPPDLFKVPGQVGRIRVTIFLLLVPGICRDAKNDKVFSLARRIVALRPAFREQTLQLSQIVQIMRM